MVVPFWDVATWTGLHATYVMSRKMKLDAT